MSKLSSIEFLLSQVGEVPEHIKEYVMNKHGIEIRTAHISGTLNALESTRKGVELINAQEYYDETFKGGQDGC